MKIVLLIQRMQLLACHGGVGAVSGVVGFANSEAGISEFRRYLRRYRRSTYVVLLDLGEEQFHWKEVPRMGRRDQKALVRSQQRKLFGATPFVSGIVDSQISPGNARLDVVHTGLSADIDECIWLTELGYAGSHVRSFHWMSLLVYAVVRPFVAPADATHNAANGLTIVIVRIDSGDDRIMAFRGSLPLISRQVSSQTRGAEITGAPGQALSEQLQQTVSYLANLADTTSGQVAADSRTTVAIAGSFAAAELEVMEQQCAASELEVIVIPVSQLTTNAVLRSARKEKATGKAATVISPVSGTFTAPLMRSVFRRKAHSYSLIFRSAGYVQRTVRHVLYGLSISLCVGAAIASAASRHIGQEMQSLVVLANEIEAQSRQLRDVEERPDWSSQYSVDAVDETIGHLRVIESADNEITPLHFIATVSEQLTRYPEIELMSVNWTSDDKLFKAISGTGVGGSGSQTKGRVNKPTDTGDFHAIVTGTVELEAQGYASAMNRFRSFVGSIRDAAIKVAPGSSVTVINLPFTESGLTISENKSGRGAFTLEVTSQRMQP